MPVEAPEGVIARNIPLWVYTSAPTVGFPRESKIWRATTLVMAAGVCFFKYSAFGIHSMVLFSKVGFLPKQGTKLRIGKNPEKNIKDDKTRGGRK